MDYNKQIWKQLTDIFREVFRDHSLEISLKTNNSDIDGWTSLSHAILIDTIEKKFNISFDLDDILTMNSVEDIYKKIEKKIVD
jgi:acyl carrier protein